MQAHTVYVISKADSIKYIMSRPVLDGRLAKWAVILKKFNLIHVSQKAIKGQVLANFLSDHLVPDNWEPNDDLPGEKVFFVDVLDVLRWCCTMGWCKSGSYNCLSLEKTHSSLFLRPGQPMLQ